MCLDVFVWQFYSCFSFSRYESHYAIPLGRKKGAKLVGFLCCRCDYRINVFGGKSALGEFFPFFLRPKPKKVNWIRRGRNIRRKKWKHERLLLKWHLASMNSLWLGGSMVHKSTKFYSPTQRGTAYLNKYSLVFCSLHFFKTWPKWSMRWLHFRRQRTWVLHQEN